MTLSSEDATSDLVGPQSWSNRNFGKAAFLEGEPKLNH